MATPTTLSTKKHTVEKLKAYEPKPIEWKSEWDPREENYGKLPLKPDFELLNRHIEWIEVQDALYPNDGPECEWHQGAWAMAGAELATSYDYDRDPETNVCGAVYCLAGKVAADARVKFLADGMAREIDIRRAANTKVGEHGASIQIVTRQGKLMPVDYYAMKRLGLDYFTGADFFSGGNTVRNMRHMYDSLVDRYKRGAIPCKTEPPKRRTKRQFEAAVARARKVEEQIAKAMTKAAEAKGKAGV